MEKKPKRNTRMISSEVRKIVCKVYHFLKSEQELTVLYHDPKCDLSHLRNIAKRTAEATGIGLRSVQRILQEEKQLQELEQFDIIENREKRKLEGDNEEIKESATEKRVKNENEDIEMDESKDSEG